MASSARNRIARLVRPDRGPPGQEPGAAARDSVQDDSVQDFETEDPAARRQAEVPAGDAPPAGSEAAAEKAPANGRKRKLLMGLGALVALAAVYFGYHYVTVGRFMVSTDDAYIRANNTTVGAKVAGYIAKIAVGDNVQVKAGDLLFKIDDGDYRIAVDNARAKIGTQEATIARIGQQVVAQQSAVEQARAQIDSANAAIQRTEADFQRQQTLNDKGFASKAVYDTSKAARDQAVATLQGAQATLAAAQAQIDVIKAQKVEAEGQLAELKTALEKAERDLSFTTIRAPVEGVFSNRMVNSGDYIQPGQRLANLVPLDDVYIDANFKETQLARLRPGQKVDISVDAYSRRKITGTVQSVAPAAGSVFTLLPPDNATGNFPKIVQRLPVRISIPRDVARENLLRAGMSVVVSVNTKPPSGAQAGTIK